MSDNKDFNNNSEYSTVTLSLDDGTELECAIIRTFPAGDKNYIALLPIADIDEENGIDTIIEKAIKILIWRVWNLKSLKFENQL